MIANEFSLLQQVWLSKDGQRVTHLCRTINVPQDATSSQIHAIKTHLHSYQLRNNDIIHQYKLKPRPYLRLLATPCKPVNKTHWTDEKYIDTRHTSTQVLMSTAQATPLNTFNPLELSKEWTEYRNYAPTITLHPIIRRIDWITSVAIKYSDRWSDVSMIDGTAQWARVCGVSPPWNNMCTRENWKPNEFWNLLRKGRPRTWSIRMHKISNDFPPLKPPCSDHIRNKIQLRWNTI